MHTFKDSAGRNWLASLTVGSVKKARDLAGVDLASALTGGGEVFKALAEDPVKLCTALYAISRPETGDAPPLDAFLDGDRRARRGGRGFFPEADPRAHGAGARGGEKKAGGSAGGDRRRVDALRLAWELAGVAGLDPRELTLRELVWAADARQRADWARTSAQLALLANVNRDPKKQPKPFSPEDFNPYARPAGNESRNTDIVKLTPKQSVKAVANVFGRGRKEAR